MCAFVFVFGAADTGGGETPDDNGDCDGGGSGGRLSRAINTQISGITLVLSLLLVVVLRIRSKVGIMRPTRLSGPVFPVAEKGVSQVIVRVYSYVNVAEEEADYLRSHKLPQEKRKSPAKALSNVYAWVPKRLRMTQQFNPLSPRPSTHLTHLTKLSCVMALPGVVLRAGGRLTSFPLIDLFWPSEIVDMGTGSTLDL